MLRIPAPLLASLLSYSNSLCSPFSDASKSARPFWIAHKQNLPQWNEASNCKDTAHWDLQSRDSIQHHSIRDRHGIKTSMKSLSENLLGREQRILYCSMFEKKASLAHSTAQKLPVTVRLGSSQRSDYISLYKGIFLRAKVKDKL